MYLNKRGWKGLRKIDTGWGEGVPDPGNPGLVRVFNSDTSPGWRGAPTAGEMGPCFPYGTSGCPRHFLNWAAHCYSVFFDDHTFPREVPRQVIFSVRIFSFQIVTFVCLRWVAFSWKGDITSPCGETQGNSTVSVLSSLMLSPGIVLPVWWPQRYIPAFS